MQRTGLLLLVLTACSSGRPAPASHSGDAGDASSDRPGQSNEQAADSFATSTGTLPFDASVSPGQAGQSADATVVDPPDAASIGMRDASSGASSDSAVAECGACPPLTANQAAFWGASCCTSDNKCGVSILNADCIPFESPGVPDPTCPPVVITLLLTVTLEGCCRPDGQCGVMEPASLGLNLNLGCVRRDTQVVPSQGSYDLIACGP